MPFDGFVARSLKNELNRSITESRIDKIYQPDKHQILIKLRRGRETHKLLISANPSFPYVAVTEMSKNNPSEPPLFCMVLRKHLQGGFLHAVLQHQNDRILFFDFHTKDDLMFTQSKRLIVELMGKHSNIILVDSDGLVIDSIRRIPSTISRQRQILPGLVYKLPPDQGKTDIEACDPKTFHEILHGGEVEIHRQIYSNFKGVSPVLAKEFCLRSKIDPFGFPSDMDERHSKLLFENIRSYMDDLDSQIEKPSIFFDGNAPKDFHAGNLNLYLSKGFTRLAFDSTSEMIDRYYSKKNEGETLKAKALNLHKLVKSRLNHANSKLEKLYEEYTQSLDYEKFKEYGDILLANMHRVERGMDKVVLNDFYNENQPVSIPLDKRLDPSKNAQRYFRKYNKYKNAKLQVHKQIQITKIEIDYLENVLTNLENSYELENIDAIHMELVKEGFLGNKFEKGNRASSQKKTDAFNRNYMIFKTRNGNTVIAGKNNIQNERVTFKKAQPKDLWFHAKNIPGSHVLLAHVDDLEESDLIDAATIAAYFSKARLSSNVPVDCTEARHVSKIKGAGPGLVTYKQQRTLYVTPEEDSIQKMKVQALD